MADSVVEILNTTLTSTELPSNSTEYTLLTTDANTSYVIKDVQFNSYGNSLFPTINGSSIGEWRTNLSGSEVIDVSSNLKVTSNSLHQEDDFSVLEGTFFATRQAPGTSDFFDSSKSFESQVALFNQENVLVNQKQTDVSHFIGQNLFEGTDAAVWNKVYGDNLYVVIKRANGYMVVYKYPANSGRVTINSTSAMAWPDPANDKIWYEAAGVLKCIDLNTDTETTIRASFPLGYEANQRIALNGDWAFLFQQTSNVLYCYNTVTDVLVQFSLSFPLFANDDADFWVSYDKLSDKFYFYFYNNADVYLNIADVTRTTMNAYTTDQTGLTVTAKGVVADGDSLMNFSFRDGLSGGMVGSLSVGNIFYYKGAYFNNFGAIYQAITAIRGNESMSNKIAEIGTIVSSSSDFTQNPWMIFYIPNQYQIKDYGSLEYVNKANLRITGIKTTA